MATKRRRARELAVQLLFQCELRGEQPAVLLATFFAEHPSDPAISEYAKDLACGVFSHQEEIDGILKKTSTHWRIERMSAVDRAVLRIGTYELQHAADVPVQVVLDEAVDLAKTYGAKESGVFVNGVLDAVARAVRPSASYGEAQED